MGKEVLKIFVNTDMVLEVGNLRDSITDALITGATVTARVLDELDVLVVGTSDPITLTEVVGSAGLYRGTVPDTASLVAGDTGTIVLSADAGSGLNAEWTLNYRVEERGH
jgi:hypothetical protein